MKDFSNIRLALKGYERRGTCIEEGTVLWSAKYYTVNPVLRKLTYKSQTTEFHPYSLGSHQYKHVSKWNKWPLFWKEPL